MTHTNRHTNRATELAARRAAVRRLADAEPRLSERAIAARLDLSRDVVRRDLAATRTNAAAPTAPTTPTAGVNTAPTTPPGAPPGAPAGEWLTIPLDQDLRDHLAVLLTAGHTLTSAITAAAELLADTCRDEWDYGRHPRGVMPRIRRVLVHPHTSTPSG